MSRTLDSFFQRLWYRGQPRWLSVLLLPLTGLFALIVAGRRLAYRAGLLAQIRVSRPVVVIGNITVGGTGKTPFTLWLAQRLATRGVRVGIVLRGYGGRSATWPRDVSAETPTVEVGDEAVLLAARTHAIVVAGPDRVAAARRAIERGAQVVLSDDGLQHYRLARDAEIAVIDARRNLGNGLMLPSGPLREPASRLRHVDLLVRTERASSEAPTVPADAIVATAVLGAAESLATRERRELHDFAGRRVHAVAGIGHPEEFFASLTARGLTIEAHPLPDHAELSASDIMFGDDAPVLMTEKDAVKCRALADHRHFAVRLELRIDDKDAARIDTLIDRLLAR